jgi:hypothetical protein
MSVFSEILNSGTEQITYEGSRSVAPASLNALTDVMGIARTAAMPLSVACKIPHAGALPDRETPIKNWRVSPLGARPKTACGALMDEVPEEHKSAVRHALETVAKELDTRKTNSLYRAAWRAAAKIVRSYKPD